MLFRLRNSLAPASLTEQPHFINFQMPLGAACWFCLASCLATENCTQDAIRMHMRHTRPLFKLCELAGYHVPEAVHTYNKRLRVLFTLRLMAARSFNRFRSLMLALYQKVLFIHNPSRNVNNFAGIVPVDGPADEAQIEKVLEILPKYCRDISIEEVIGIGALITSPSVSIKNIDLSVCWQPRLFQMPLCFGSTTTTTLTLRTFQTPLFAQQQCVRITQFLDLIHRGASHLRV